MKALLYLPESLRPLLKEPFGRVYSSSELKDVIALLSKKSLVISVGDQTLIEMISQHFFPNLAVFDGKTKRSSIDPLHLKSFFKFYPDIARYENPPGTLNPILINELSSHLNYLRKKPTKRLGIFIEGEEDLVSLPVMCQLKKNEVLLYGQPEEGIVLVEHSKELIELSQRYLSSFVLR